MQIFPLLFYILAALILASTALAVTRRNLVHAVLYLILSFFGSALLLYLFGAPLLAMLEVIIYAGAIMILFLFIVMMLRVDTGTEPLYPIRQLAPGAVVAAGYLGVMIAVSATRPAAEAPLAPAMAAPADFGRYLFRTHWLAIEIVSFLLLVVLIGALYLGRPPSDGEPPGREEAT